MSTPAPAWIAAPPAAFAGALAAMDGSVLVLCHNDADGLSAGALLARGLARAGREAPTRLVGRFESAWSEAIAGEVRAAAPGGLVVTDLGTHGAAIVPGLPTVLIDHHVPQGLPEAGVAISGYGLDPTPSSSLLALQALASVAEVDDLLWIAALGMIGDYGEKAPFPELARARERHGAKVLREATSLINAPRRAAKGDAGPAFDLLMEADGPEAIVAGEGPQAQALRDARAEVKAALEAARKLPPRFAGRVALVTLDSPCQIHPLVAQSWTGRLRNQIVIAANTGFRPGYVHFAARSATGANLVAFLKEHAPPGLPADGAYGQGHEGASGGALPVELWDAFLAGLGFKPA
jgi:single-stranded-DNA-specific exonuclease